MLDKKKILEAYTLGRTNLGLFVAVRRQLVVPAPFPRKYSLVWGNRRDYSFQRGLWIPSHMTITQGMFSQLLRPGLRQQLQATYAFHAPKGTIIPKVAGLWPLPAIFPGKMFFVDDNLPYSRAVAERLRSVPREEYLHDANYWIGLEEDLESRNAR